MDRLNLAKRYDIARNNSTYSLSETKLSEILTDIAQNKYPTTLAFDGWTNVRSNKVTGVMLIANDKPYFVKYIENWRWMRWVCTVRSTLTPRASTATFYLMKGILPIGWFRVYGSSSITYLK